MITTTVEQENKTSEIKYPCIMIYDGGLIVLFPREGCGTVLQAGESCNSIGDYSESWDDCYLTPFYGKITLEQKP